MGGEPSKREKHIAAHNALVRVSRYLGRHRIYLPEAVAESLQKMLTDMRSPVTGFGVYVRFDEAMMSDSTSAQKLDAWSKGWTQLTEEIPKARALLEKELRILLGEAPAPAAVGGAA